MGPEPGSGERLWIDKTHPAVYRAQVKVAVAVRSAVADAGLGRILVELVNIRVSQINQCAYCLDVHVRDSLLAGESTQRLAVLPAWRETGVFTAQERAALAIAESLTTLPDAGALDSDLADAAGHLTDEQVSAVCWVVVAMNAFNRISIASRHPVRLRPLAPEASVPGPTGPQAAR